VHVPEEWARQQRAAETRSLIIRVVNTLVFAGLLVGAAVLGMIAWSRRAYAPSLFLAGAGLMLVVSFVRSANNWPAVLGALRTEQPLQLQIIGVIGIGLVGLVLSAVLVGLVLGAIPHKLSHASSLTDRDALQLGVSVGFFGAAASAIAALLRTPIWARMPDVDAAGTYVPLLQAAIDPLPRLLMASAIVFAAILLVDQWTAGWTRRRSWGIVALTVVGFAAGGVPSGVSVGGWLLAGLVTSAGLVIAYTTVLRFDLTMTPIALAAMIAIGTVGQGTQRPFPGALLGSMIGALLVMLAGWWWFSALRRARARVAGALRASEQQA
jgi:hypothetical protein